jgi:DNA-binding CsgD family transcriptional regulator
LVGRSEELALLDGEVDGGRPAMVVAGAVGVGKSRLLAGWLADLDARSRPTVVVRATKATATIPFGAFARWVPRHLGETGDRLGILLAAVARLAEHGTDLVVAVDDAQHLDDGSAALVLHLAQHTGTGLLVAVRSGEPCPDAVVALWKEGLASRLELQALSEQQTVELLERVLGGAVAPGTRRRLWRLTAGNPLYLHEVVHAALAQGVLVPTAAGWRWEGTLAEATRLVGLVSERVGDCGPAGRQALERLALGEPLPVDVMAQLAPPEVLADLEGRRLAVVDRRDAADAPVMRLSHPLYAEVLRAELPAFTARNHHRALADAGVRTGLDRRNPLRVATWLLEAGDATGHPELLVRASYIALNTDDFELSARLARAAAEAGGGWRARLRLAEALGPLRRWGEAETLLDQLSTGDDGAEARAAAARVRAEQSYWHRREDVSVARRIVAEAAASIPPPARSSLLVHGARYATLDLDLDAAIRLADEAIADADSADRRLEGIGCAALAKAFKGHTAAALALVKEAGPATLQAIETAPLAGGYLTFAFVFAAFLDGRFDAAARFFEAYRNHKVARMAGTPGALASVWLADASLAQGRVATATSLSRHALGVFGDVNHFGRATWIAGTLARAAAQAGDGATAEEAIAWLDERPRPAVRADELLADLARAWVQAGRGELSGAREAALGVAAQARERGASMIELLGLLDTVRFGGAGLAVDRLDELAVLVDGRLVPLVVAFARAASTEDGDALDDVSSRLADLGAHLLAAEAATVASAAHRGAGRRRSATASQAAAQGWHARCEGAATPLLTGLGAVPLATLLTDREREVAGLAARGRTSRQIAEALAISVRTVDSHLNHIFTKLGISDRTALAAALRAAGPGGGLDVDRPTGATT